MFARRRNRRTRSIVYAHKFDLGKMPKGIEFVGYKVPDKRTDRTVKNYTRLVVCETHRYCVACIGTDEKELLSYPDLFCPKCSELTSGAGISLEEI